MELWEVETGNLYKGFGGHKELWSSQFSPDGKLLSTGDGENTVRLWEVKSGKLTHVLTGNRSGYGLQVDQLRFSPDGQYLAVAADYEPVRLWETKSGKLIGALGKSSAYMGEFPFTPDGRFFTFRYDDKTVKLFELKGGELFENLSWTTDSIYGISFSPDGQYIVSANANEILRLWLVIPELEFY